MSDVTNYVGRDYTITSYGCNKSVDSADEQIVALTAEKEELQDIFDGFLETLTSAITARVTTQGSSWSSYASANVGSTLVEDVEVNPRTGTCTSRSHDGTEAIYFGNYGVENASEWEVITTISYACSANEPDVGTFTVYEYVAYRPPYTIFDNNGSRPKAMILDFDNTSGWGLLATPSIHNKSGEIFREEQPLELVFRFGENIDVSCLTDQMFVSDGWTFIPFSTEGNMGYPLIQVLSPSGALWDSNVDIVKAMSDANFVADHIYAYPSSEGVYGVARKIESLETGQEIMENTKAKYKDIDSFYRLGHNNASPPRTFTNWESLGVSSTYIDEWNIALVGDIESQTPSGTELFYDIDDTGSSPVTGYSHAHNKVIASSYHLPSMATYVEVILTPDVMTTVNLTGVSASNEFGELLIADDIVSLGVSGGSIYTDLLYINQLTVWIGGETASSLPVSGSTIPITATHGSGLVNYFNVFKTTDGNDPYAGMTVIRVGDGTPLSETIKDVYIQGA